MSKKNHHDELMTPEELIQYLKKSTAPITKKIRNVMGIRGYSPVYVLMRIAKLKELQDELGLNDEMLLNKINNYVKKRLSGILSVQQYKEGEFRFDSSQHLYNLNYADFIETIKMMKEKNIQNFEETFANPDNWEDYLKQPSASAENKIGLLFKMGGLPSTYILLRILMLEELQEAFGIKEEKLLAKIKSILLSRLGHYMTKSDRRHKTLRFSDFPNLHELGFPKFVDALNVLKERRQKMLKERAKKRAKKISIVNRKVNSKERDRIYNLTKSIDSVSCKEFEYGITDT